MKKSFLLNIKWLLACFLLVAGIANMWSTSYTTGTTYPTTGWSTSGSTITCNSITWTYSSSTYIGSGGASIQVGSKKNPQTSAWTFQTAISNFGTGKRVTSVTLCAYTTATTATYDISVGGSSVKSGSLTTSADNYTASSLSATTGNIVITMTGSSTSKAMYLCSVSVEYEDAASCTATPSVGAASLNGSFYMDQK